MAPNARRVALLLALGAAGCFVHVDAPQSRRAGAAGALGGHAPPGFDKALACGRWEEAVGTADDSATTHVSFPELSPEGCWVAVRYRDGKLAADPIPPGCGYPGELAGVTDRLAESASRYERIAAGDDLGVDTPFPVACGLPAEARRAAAGVNARTLRALARRVRGGRRFPYAIASTFGFGHPAHAASALVDWRPGDACPALDKKEMDLLAVNVVRAGRAAQAHFGGVAPVVSLSGGAVHSPLYEAFMMHYLVTCRFGVRDEAVLLNPCADHTHTNVRNTGACVVEVGGRTAYVVTDDGLQGGYLQEWTVFDALGGSIDQRALRDFGHLLGSWRQASIGIESGFWFTPYRFWAEPRRGLGEFACVR